MTSHEEIQAGKAPRTSTGHDGAEAKALLSRRPDRTRLPANDPKGAQGRRRFLAQLSLIWTSSATPRTSLR